MSLETKILKAQYIFEYWQLKRRLEKYRKQRRSEFKLIIWGKKGNSERIDCKSIYILLAQIFLQSWK